MTDDPTMGEIDLDRFEADDLELSVVIPVHDEQGGIPALVDRLTRVFDNLGANAEAIFVDDGSTDATLAVLARAHAMDPRIRAVSLSRNFGHQIAITAGLMHAGGQAVVVMDGDHQDPPESIGPLWARLREGFDVVYAIRQGRPEPFWKRWAYALFYRILDKMAVIPIPLDAGDFGILSRRVVNLLCAMPEQRRFLRGMRAWLGFRQTGLPVERGKRYRGRSKFTLGRLLGLALDGFLGFSDSPLRALGLLGLLSSLAAALGLALAGLRRLRWGDPLEGWVCVAALVALFGGALLLSVAIVGEYVTRILQEVSGRPLFVIRRRIGVDSPVAGSAAPGGEPASFPGQGYWDRSGHDPLRDPELLS